MKIFVECDKDDKGTSIEMANAIIRWNIDRAFDDETLMEARADLAAISEHIQVYLSHSTSQFR